MRQCARKPWWRVHPTAEHYPTQLLEMAKVLHRLTQLTELTRLLQVPADQSYAAALMRYHRECCELFNDVSATADDHAAVGSLLEELVPRIRAVRGAGLVPVHGDPNDENVLLTAGGPLLLDWETLHLSDPVHDIAQVLWWAAPRRACSQPWRSSAWMRMTRRSSNGCISTSPYGRSLCFCCSNAPAVLRFRTAFSTTRSAQRRGLGRALIYSVVSGRRLANRAGPLAG